MFGLEKADFRTLKDWEDICELHNGHILLKEQKEGPVSAALAWRLIPIQSNWELLSLYSKAIFSQFQ